MIKDRATPFHGGYRIEQRSSTPNKASLFIFVYPYGLRGALYVIRKAGKREPILKHYVPR